MELIGEGFLGFKLPRPLCSSVCPHSSSVLFLWSKDSLIQQIQFPNVIHWFAKQGNRNGDTDGVSCLASEIDLGSPRLNT